MAPPNPTRKSLRPAPAQAATGVYRLGGWLVRIVGSRTGIPWQTIVLLAIAATVGLLSSHLIRQSLQNFFSLQLNTVLDANETALRLWATDQLGDARRHGSNQAFVRLSKRMLEDNCAVPNPLILICKKHVEALRNGLETAARTDGYAWAGIVDPKGRILASTGPPDRANAMTSDGLALLADAYDGEARLLRMSQEREIFRDFELGNAPHHAATPFFKRLTVIAPVGEPDGEVVAAFVAATDAESITTFLTTARMGETGDTYALDDRGNMLSRSDFEPQLRQLGLLPPSDDPRTFYSLPVRDPGQDLARSGLPETDPAGWLFTRAAAGIIAGGGGIDLDGYRNYRGVEVIGAWRWLPDLDVGIITEFQSEEAYAILTPIRWAHGVLGGSLALFLLFSVTSSFAVRLLRREVREARELGQYTLERKIGEGGMGTVYLARHALLERPTALKTLRPDAMNEDNLVRFEREVQLMSRLSHPNTVQVYDFGRTPDDVFYYAMEFIPGITLADLVEIEGSVSPARAIRIIRDVAAALEDAHAVGLVHRDIKPLNIMLTRSKVQGDIVKVLDFGLVKDVATPEERELTSTDIVGGTPPFIAPERLSNPRVADPRSDLYSLGGVAFLLLTGQLVFDGDSPAHICYKAMHEDPPNIADILPDIPGDLAELVMSCLARDPDQRPKDAAAVFDRLNDLASHHPWLRAQSRTWWDENAARIDQRTARSTP